MYGVFIALMGLLTIAVTRGALDTTAGRDSPSRTEAMPAREEAIAESIAGEIQWALADAATACIEQPAAGTPAGCAAPAASGAIVTDAALAGAALPAYAVGNTMGFIRTYYVTTPGTARYLAGTWLPASAGLAARYCPSVLRDLSRLTGNSRWVAPYDANTNAIHVYLSDTTGAPLASEAIVLGAPAGALEDGCPVMVEPVDR